MAVDPNTQLMLATASAGSSPIAIPTANPGELYIPSLGKTIQQIEWREDDFYDTVAQPAGLVTSGTELDYFINLQGKQLQHSNLKKSSSIPANQQIVVSRVGVHFVQSLGANIMPDSDIIAAAHASVFTFQVNDRLITQGPAYKYQSGYGMTGSTTRNNAGIVTTGVPSAAAAPSLYVAQPVTDNDDIVGSLQYPSQNWLNNNTDGDIAATMPTFVQPSAATAFLHGIIRKPQGA